MNRNAFTVPLLNREGVVPSEHLQYILDNKEITEDVFNLVKKNPNIRYWYIDRYYAVTTIHETLIVLSAVGYSDSKTTDENTETTIAYNYYLRLKIDSIKLLKIQTGSSGSTSNDYASLDNKPQINGKTLESGDNTFEYLGLNRITDDDINNIDSTNFVQED